MVDYIDPGVRFVLILSKYLSKFDVEINNLKLDKIPHQIILQWVNVFVKAMPSSGLWRVLEKLVWLSNIELLS